uniref:Adenosine receptor A1 n=1 Tax=Callorhinchus milii TaxID=7868 RepID=A0A4W3GE52_CALMI
MSDQVDVVYIVVELLIAVTSILGNVLVCWAVKINRSLRDTTFCFIVSLALADIAVGALAIPLAITISLGMKTHFYTCLFIACILLTLTQSSILSLLAIAVDRYLRVKIPTRYRIIVTQRRAWIAVAICWSSEAVQEQEKNSSERYITCKFTLVVRMDYMVYFNFFGWVLFPLLIMFGLYAEIFYLIKKQLSKKMAKATDSRRYFGKELKLAKSLALVLFLFAVCWLPLHTMNSLKYFFPKWKVTKTAFYIGIFMSHANSAVNPVIYAFRIKKFRVTFFQIWKKYILCKNENLSIYNYDGRTATENNSSV